MSTIKERPILFNGPMVRATLSGQKTVTRRAIKIQPHIDASGNFCVGSSNYGQDLCGKPVTKHFINSYCPYGKPGDRLWVRETFAYADKSGTHDAAPDDHWRPVRPGMEPEIYRCWYRASDGHAADGFSKPSIHMPRWASRILLEITDVRVERLQNITEEQALAEGIKKHSDGGYHVEDGKHYSDCPVESFAGLWSSVGGNWDANPWVWVVEFKRIT